MLKNLYGFLIGVIIISILSGALYFTAKDNWKKDAELKQADTVAESNTITLDAFQRAYEQGQVERVRVTRKVERANAHIKRKAKTEGNGAWVNQPVDPSIPEWLLSE